MPVMQSLPQDAAHLDCEPLSKQAPSAFGLELSQNNRFVFCHDNRMFNLGD